MVARVSVQIVSPVLELLDHDGKTWRAEPGAVVPGLPQLRFAQQTSIHIALWSGVTGPGAVNGWQRPVDALSFLPLVALRWAGVEGLAPEQWIALPKNWGLPVVHHHEASPEGGLIEVVTLLWRRGGWLVEANACSVEPVVEAVHDLRQETSGAGYDWEPHPQRPPFRPQQEAEADGFGSELQQQLSLLNGVPFALIPEAEGLSIAMPEGLAVCGLSIIPNCNVQPCPGSDGPFSDGDLGNLMHSPSAVQVHGCKATFYANLRALLRIHLCGFSPVMPIVP